MPIRGRGKGKAPASSTEAREGSHWQGIQAEFNSMMQRFMQTIGRGTSSETKSDPWIKKLSCMHALAFDGRGKPEKCEAWLWKIEKILESMECPKVKWVQLASFLFESNAEQWWRVTQRLKFPDKDLLMISWEEF